jgi:hypothetical protein
MALRIPPRPQPGGRRVRIAEWHRGCENSAPQIVQALPEIPPRLSDQGKNGMTCDTDSVKAGTVPEALYVATVKSDPVRPVQIAPVRFKHAWQ